MLKELKRGITHIGPGIPITIKRLGTTCLSTAVVNNVRPVVDLFMTSARIEACGTSNGRATLFLKKGGNYILTAKPYSQKHLLMNGSSYSSLQEGGAEISM
jgi:hypothetical protein